MALFNSPELSKNWVTKVVISTSRVVFVTVPPNVFRLLHPFWKVSDSPVLVHSGGQFGNGHTRQVRLINKRPRCGLQDYLRTDACQGRLYAAYWACRLPFLVGRPGRKAFDADLSTTANGALIPRKKLAPFLGTTEWRALSGSIADTL